MAGNGETWNVNSGESVKRAVRWSISHSGCALSIKLGTGPWAMCCVSKNLTVSCGRNLSTILIHVTVELYLLPRNLDLY